MLTGYRHAAIDCGFGDIDGARRQANGSAYGAVANRQALACRDNIAADGGVVQVEALTGPVQVAFDARWGGVFVGRENVSGGIRAGKGSGGKGNERQRDEGECEKEATSRFATLRRRELIARHRWSFVRCSTCI